MKERSCTARLARAPLLALVGVLLGWSATDAQDIPACPRADAYETEVIVDGAFLGIAPAQLQLRPGEIYEVTFSRPGYEDASTVLHGDEVARWVVLDVFTGVLGYALDAKADNWIFVELVSSAVAAVRP